MCPQEDLNCMWCNKEFQQYYLEQQDKTAAANQDDHAAIMSRLNKLTVLILGMVIILVAKDVVTMNDLKTITDVAGATGTFFTSLQ